MSPRIEKQHYTNGILASCHYYSDDHKLHRADGPAVEWFYKSGIPELRHYYYNNVFHREDGPALLTFYPDGKLHTYKWYFERELHRLDGPAIEVFDKDGVIYLYKPEYSTQFIWLGGFIIHIEIEESYYPSGNLLRKESYRIHW